MERCSSDEANADRYEFKWGELPPFWAIASVMMLPRSCLCEGSNLFVFSIW